MEKYLECAEGNSSKFWQIKVTGSKVLYTEMIYLACRLKYPQTSISYGKIGSSGQAQEKGTERRCRNSHSNGRDQITVLRPPQTSSRRR